MNSIDIAVERPLLFLILIPALILGIIPFLRLNKKRRASTKHLIPFIIHLTLIFILSGLLAGVDVVETTDEKLETKVVFLADVSDSNIALKEQMNQYIKNVIEISDKEKTQFGLVMFANNVIETVDQDEFNTNADDFIKFDKGNKPTNQTNIEQAIKIGAEMFEGVRQNKKMIILSDGIETLGSGVIAANQIDEGIQISGAYMNIVEGNQKKEVQLVSIATNNKIPEGGEVSVELVLKSTSFVGNAKVTLYDGDLVTPKQLDIEPGINVIQMKYKPEVVGVNTIRATVETMAKDDLLDGNNTLYTWYSLDAKKTILIIDGDATNINQPSQFEQVNNSLIFGTLNKKYLFETKAPQSFPKSLEELLAYDQVVLMDVNFSELPENAGANLQRYVEEVGRGLFVSFGDNFYEIGKDGYQYKDSPIAEILPVNLRLEGERETVAMVLVVDLSSSMKEIMGGSKSRFETLVESVNKVIMLGAKDPNAPPSENEEEDDPTKREGFSDTDYFGIVCFDQDSHIALDMQQLGDYNNRLEICELVEYELRHYYYAYYLNKDNTESDIPINKNDGTKYTSQGYKYPNYNYTQGGEDKSTGNYIKSHGTSYKWAIQSASDMLSRTNSKTLLHIKQVLLMSDGAPSDKGSGYEGIVERMAKAGTITSSISIGASSGAQYDELKKIADAGNGTIVTVNTASDLTAEIVEKAEEVSTELVNERPVEPKRASYDSSVLQHVEKYEVIGGYYSSVIKDDPNAKLIVYVDQLKPLYAEWQYGLGKVGVFMSDLGNSDWTGVLFDNDLDDSLYFVANMFDATMNRQVSSTGIEYSATRSETTTTVVADVPRDLRTGELVVADVAGVNGDANRYVLDPVTLTRFRGEIPTPNTDETYTISLSIIDGNEVKTNVKDSLKFAVTGYYNKEYDVFSTEGKQNMDDVIKKGGGIALEESFENLFVDDEGAIKIFNHDISTPIIIAALVLFVLDILFRNIVVKRKKEKAQMTEEEQLASMKGR